MHVVETEPKSAAQGKPNLADAQTPAQRAVVLCVDDEPSILSALRRVLARDRHEVLIANSAADALEILADRPVDLIISDMRMPNMSGAQFLAEAASRWPDTVRLLLTGYSDLESAADAVNQGGIYRYLAKPWADDDLKLTVREGIDKRRMKHERDRLLAITHAQNNELSSLNSELESRVHKRTEQLRATYAALKSNFQSTVEMFSHMLDLHDQNSAGHGRRVADLARAIGEAEKLNEKALNDLENAALLHDIGKLALPERLRHQAYDKLDLAQREELEDRVQRRTETLRNANESLKQAQAQLLQSEKMASIGQLSAGIAHEINNPIAFVSSNLSTLDEYSRELLDVLHRYQQLGVVMAGSAGAGSPLSVLNEGIDLDFISEDLPVLIRESVNGVERVRKIVLDLKNFSPSGRSEWQDADLHDGIEATLNIAKHQLKNQVEVIRNYGLVPPIECIPSEINQVVMNLLVNAAQAIDGEGTITIATGTDEGVAFVAISDTGCGIEPSAVQKIFDPFFTTKPVGPGTG
ncbi:MAG: response regulator RpfG family c-di-GMP phosphodiesterase, partial [Gammaproteobacteria bacterium]